MNEDNLIEITASLLRYVSFGHAFIMYGEKYEYVTYRQSGNIVVAQYFDQSTDMYDYAYHNSDDTCHVDSKEYSESVVDGIKQFLQGELKMINKIQYVDGPRIWVVYKMLGAQSSVLIEVSPDPWPDKKEQSLFFDESKANCINCNSNSEVSKTLCDDSAEVLKMLVPLEPPVCETKVPELDYTEHQK